MTATWTGTEDATAITAWDDNHVGWLIGEGVNRVLLPPESDAEDVAARRKRFAEHEHNLVSGSNPHELVAVCEVEWHLLAAADLLRQVAGNPEASPRLHSLLESFGKPLQSLIGGLDRFTVEEQRRLERHCRSPFGGGNGDTLGGDVA